MGMGVEAYASPLAASRLHRDGGDERSRQGRATDVRARPGDGAFSGCLRRSVLAVLALVLLVALLDAGYDQWRRRVMMREAQQLIDLARAGKVDEIVDSISDELNLDEAGPVGRAVVVGDVRAFSERVRSTRGEVLVRDVLYDHQLGDGPSWTRWVGWVLIQVDARPGYDPGRIETILFIKHSQGRAHPASFFDMDETDKVGSGAGD